LQLRGQKNRADSVPPAAVGTATSAASMAAKREGPSCAGGAAPARAHAGGGAARGASSARKIERSSRLRAPALCEQVRRVARAPRRRVRTACAAA
jgi:hypothetical protein